MERSAHGKSEVAAMTIPLDNRALQSEAEIAVFAEGLTKRFGETEALKGVDLVVPRGTVLGLLGPNGAGKTTAVRILTTLLKPDGGSARIAGFDVLKQPDEVRRRIGLAGQYAAVDELLTGRANLEMVGRLYHLPVKDARSRAADLLKQFDLEDAADRMAKTYSGGMRRRLDLAASLVASPPVLFLDEPSTGLDPRSRAMMWDTIRSLVAGGTTLLLTTQYLEEADLLADHIVVIDHGRVIASGTPTELKTTVGGEQIDVTISDAGRLDEAVAILRWATDGEPKVDVDTRHIVAPTENGISVLASIIRSFDQESIAVDDLALRRPTLDEVFLNLTGGDDDEAPPPERALAGARSEEAA
jgi:ABC-2 type transport system ATP-binding protein